MRNYKHGLIGLLILIAIAGIIYCGQQNSSERQIDEFMNLFYDLSYDEYVEMQLSVSESNFESLMQRGKFETFFSNKGFEGFVANGLSYHYINNIIDMKCDVKLIDHQVTLSLSEGTFQYNYTASLEISYIETGEKVLEEENGIISGLIIDDLIQIERVKIFGYLFM